MKKARIFVFVVALLITVLAACGANGATVELTDEYFTSDGNFSLHVPDTWGLYDAVEQDGLVLTLQNYDTAFASVYYFGYVDDDDLSEWTADLEAYYGEYLIGETKSLEINGMEAIAMQYSMVDLSEYEEEYNYHGIEYLIKTEIGIVEVDVYYAQGVIEGKVFDPSEEELELLARIAETFQVAQ